MAKSEYQLGSKNEALKLMANYAIRDQEAFIDDTDGDTSADQNLTVMFGLDADGYVTNGWTQTLRFRESFGGGQSPRVRNASTALKAPMDGMAAIEICDTEYWRLNPVKSSQ